MKNSLPELIWPDPFIAAHRQESISNGFTRSKIEPPDGPQHLQKNVIKPSHVNLLKQAEKESCVA